MHLPMSRRPADLPAATITVETGTRVRITDHIGRVGYLIVSAGGHHLTTESLTLSTSDLERLVQLVKAIEAGDTAE